MNLHHYFDPVDFSKFAEMEPHAWKYSMGANIEKHTLRLNETNLGKVELAIVGVPYESTGNEFEPTASTDRIRGELYRLAGQGKINIVDYGNLKAAKSNKGYYLALRDVVDYLGELNITAIVIGGSQDLSYGICQAFKNNRFFSFCSIDARLDVRKGKEPYSPTNYLSRIFSGQPDLFQFSLLGYQSHYVAKEYFSKVKGVNNHIRLGHLREDITRAEPVFRNSDFLSFDFCALKHNEAPGKGANPNGLRNEEACQLAKYAGLSDRLNVFGLFGVDVDVDNSELAVRSAAQVVWYFIEGYLQRSHKKPSDKEGFAVYKVELQELAGPLVFCKNEETGQWWLQVQPVHNEMVYMACSEKEYIEATHNEIPELWLKYIQKIDEILK